MPASPRPARSSRVDPYDLVTFGETMIRLTVPDSQRLEAASLLRVTIGGAESNVALALARLGRRVAWLSALPENPLGRRVAAELRGHGVDTSHVIWTSAGRIGVYFMEPGSHPRPTRVLYDRANSAVARIDPSQIDTSILDGAGILHLTGITPALSDGCADACLKLVEAASDYDTPVVLDVNYRARLWSAREAAAGLQPLLNRVTVLFCGAGDARTIWGDTGEPLEIAQSLLNRSNAAIVVVTLGEDGAIALQRDGTSWSQAGIRVEIVDAVGAGDAFAAGFLHAWLDDPLNIQSALRSAVALASLKMTIPGDHPLVTSDERTEILAQLDHPDIEIDR